jgi:hypothetical protein
MLHVHDALACLCLSFDLFTYLGHEVGILHSVCVCACVCLDNWYFST